MNDTKPASLFYVEPAFNETELNPDFIYPEDMDIEDIIHFNPHTRNISHMAPSNETISVNMGNKTVHIKHYQGDHHEHSHYQRHHHFNSTAPVSSKVSSQKIPTYVDPNMQAVQDYMASIDVEQAKSIANYYIGVGMNAALVWCCIIFGILQYCYIANLTKMARA